MRSPLWKQRFSLSDGSVIATNIGWNLALSHIHLNLLDRGTVLNRTLAINRGLSMRILKNSVLVLATTVSCVFGDSRLAPPALTRSEPAWTKTLQIRKLDLVVLTVEI